MQDTTFINEYLKYQWEFMFRCRYFSIYFGHRIRDWATQGFWSGVELAWGVRHYERGMLDYKRGWNWKPYYKTKEQVQDEFETRKL